MSLLALCMTFSACDGAELSSLSEVSRPYAGEYVCVRLRIAGEDRLSGFDRIVLSLGRDGGFTFSYRKTDGGNGEYRGKYAPEGNFLRFTADDGGRERSFAATYERGEILFLYNFAGRIYSAVFALP